MDDTSGAALFDVIPPGGLAPRLGWGPKPGHCRLTLLLRGVVDASQRVAEVPVTSLHFIRNKTEWEESRRESE